MKQSFNNDLKYLMVFGCHHKVGTSWFTKILSHVGKEFNLNFQYSNQSGIRSKTDIFFDDHTRLDPKQIDVAYRGVHLIRDPRDIIVSGYFYHKWTEEKWANQPKEQWNGMTYKEKINTYNEVDGIIFEMNHIGKDTINEIISWDYNNKNFLEVKYEDLLKDKKQEFIKIFEHYNFNKTSVKKCLEIVEEYDFKKMKRKEKTKHLRKGVAGDWKNYFNEEVNLIFKKQFPGVLEMLDYN